MSIAGYKHIKIIKIVFYLLEIIMLVGLAYLICKASGSEKIITILVSVVVILMNLFILFIKKQCLLGKKRQEEIFQNTIHDFKTPLHSILGFIELSKLKLKQIEESSDSNSMNNSFIEVVSKNLDIIEKEGNRLIQMSNDFLNMTRLNIKTELIIKQNFTVGELMGEIVPLLESLCNQKKLNCRVEIKEEDEQIFGDKEKIVKVLYNLISNAAKYTDNGYINCGCFKRDSDMLFYIEDTGCGIPREDNRVFERFYTSDGDHKMGGNGIGLAICKDIVNMHNGQIWFESNLNTGTKFCFSIPII